jgi:hypothetical protein
VSRLDGCRVKGDGNRYKFILRDEEAWDGMSWSNTFDTKPGRGPTHRYIHSYRPNLAHSPWTVFILQPGHTKQVS